nr:uncharacterized protein LOC109159918 [Ipomoea batatas]
MDRTRDKSDDRSLANGWQRRNSIHRLQNSVGDWVDGREQIVGVVVSYFRELFTSTAGDRGETIVHIFGECSFAKHVWLAYGMPWGCSGNVVLLDWIKDIFDSFTSSELAHFITICWGIWNARNQKVWNNVDSSPKLVVKHSLSYLKEWKSVRSSPHLQDVSTQRSTDKWVKPDFGTLKLNIDAFVHQNAFHVGMGWILRDHQGYFVAAQAATRPGPLHPREAEALAVREALSWLKDNQWEDVVETDAEILVHHLHKPSVSPFGLLIADISSLLSTLKDVKLCHVRRDANVVAHLLASYDFSHFARETW